MPLLTTLLFDLDGVLRHFDPGHGARLEARYGLAPGSLARQAFAADLVHPAVRGKISRREWVRRLGERVAHAQAAEEFLAHRGHVDARGVELVGQLRSRGLVVGLLTNATDSLDEELAAVGLAGCFDHVFSSSQLGAMKPEAEIYARVIAALGEPADRVGFVDDQQAHVDSAGAAGLRALRFAGWEAVLTWLDGLGVGLAEWRPPATRR